MGVYKQYSDPNCVCERITMKEPERKKRGKWKDTERERETEGEEEKERKRDGLVSCVALATAARKQQECLFSCFFFVFLACGGDDPGCDIGALLSLMSASANNLPGSLQAALVISNLEPGSWSRDI